jgi:FkbM family methyltransferase
MNVQIKGKNFVVDKATGINKGANDDWDFWSYVNENRWDPYTWEVLTKFLDPTKTFLDIGAWIGPTALYGSFLSRRCVAIEPDPVAFNKFQTNLTLNPSIINIELYPIALSKETGLTKMGSTSTPGDSQSSLIFSESDQSWEVEAFTIEDIFSRYNITDCSFIKMDIEGGEFSVLPFMRNFLEFTGITLYVALHLPLIQDQDTAINNLKESLSHYKNIYNTNGDKLDLNNIENQIQGFVEIIATNQDW